MARSSFASVTLAFLFSAWVASGASTVVDGRSSLERLRHRHVRVGGSSVISAMEFKHQLRVCNAYPYAEPMDVYLGKEKLTEAPMPYKVCGEFVPHLKKGDKIEFKVHSADAVAGSFSVAELPAADAVLVLAIYRHDISSTAVSFASHIFSNTAFPQLAVVDTYRGKSDATIHVLDANVKKGEEQRSEELRYNSVVAVNPGKYEVVLKGVDGKDKAKHQLVALNGESYVAVRVGVDSKIGKAYPEEIIVFPHSDPGKLSGAAAPRHSLIGGALAALLALAAMP